MLGRGGATVDTLDLSDTLTSILASVPRLVPCAYAAILVRNEADDTLDVKALVGLNDDQRQALPPESLRVPHLRGVSGAAFRRQEMVLVPDVRAFPDFVDHRLSGVRSEVAIPLYSHGEVIGVLDAARAGTDAFRPADLQLLALFASYASLAIEKAQFSAEQEERIAELRDVRLELEASQAHYRALLEHVPAVTYAGILERPFTVTYISPDVEAMLGYTPDEWRADPDLWPRLVHPDDREFLLTPTLRSIEPHHRMISEYRMIARDGRIVWVHDEWISLPAEGSDTSVHGILIDITERKLAEEERLRLLAAEQEARALATAAMEANRLKSEFLANMSHELRTPLNAILGFAEIIQDERLGPILPDYKDFLFDIHKSATYLLQTINDLLDLSKIEADRMDFYPEEIDLRSFVANVHENASMLAQKRDVGITCRVDPGLDSMVTDPNRLRQILYNYLSNAIKFTPVGGSVSLRVFRDDECHVRFEVRDTGVGIAATDLPRLFRPFQQLDGGTGKRHQGSGLGLSLTKRLVEALGGYVGAESELGKGSVFFAVLPSIAPTPVSEENDRDAPSAASLS